MKIKVWGCRGSIPCPGPATVKYGGNTSCYEVILDDGRSIVLDGGTGIRELGRDLVRRAAGPLDLVILFNHTHWDHIAGFPFFEPLYDPRNRTRIYGPFNLINWEASFERTMAIQWDRQYFPIPLSHVPTSIEYHEMKEGEHLIDGIKVTAHFMNHPIQCLGYRIDHGGSSLFYTGDTEPYRNFWADGADDEDDDEEMREMREQAELVIQMRQRQVVDLVRGVDFLIADAQYTAEEYRTKIGWGHTSMTDALELGLAAGAKRIGLSHHEPLHADDRLDALAEECRAYVAARGSTMEVIMVAEGDEYECS